MGQKVEVMFTLSLSIQGSI